MLRLRLLIALVVVDVLALSAATILSGMIWLGDVAEWHGFILLATFVPFYLLAGSNGGAFTSENLVRRRRSILRAVRSVMIACVGVIFAAFFLKAGADISRMTLLISGALGMVMVAAGRAAFHSAVVLRFGNALRTDILVIDGTHVTAPEGTYVLNAQTLNLRCDLNDPLMLDRVGRLLGPADRVVIACSAERRREWAMVLKGANIQAEIVCPEITAVGPLGTGSFEGVSTVIVATGSLDLYQRGLKRALDLTLAGLAVLLLAPLLLIVAIAVRLDSQGSVLFIQDRVGRGNRLFGMYKFRSMRADACDRSGNRSTSRGDDRITRVGKFIRATSIDELPQLFNILRGNMSFVGPRPHALGSLAGDLLFWEVDERYWHRHACKPGLTGLAQVRGFRGATHHENDLINRLQADLEYVAGWTIWRDLSILLVTLRVVIHRNAY